MPAKNTFLSFIIQRYASSFSPEGWNDYNASWLITGGKHQRRHESSDEDTLPPSEWSTADNWRKPCAYYRFSEVHNIRITTREPESGKTNYKDRFGNLLLRNAGSNKSDTKAADAKQFLKDNRSTNKNGVIYEDYMSQLSDLEVDLLHTVFFQNFRIFGIGPFIWDFRRFGRIFGILEGLGLVRSIMWKEM